MNRKTTGTIVPLIAMATLTACQSTPTKTPPPQVHYPPAEALLLCPSLADVSLGQGSADDLARALQVVADRYQECRAGKEQLVEWWEREKND